MDARTSTIDVTFGPNDQAVADALQGALGDAVTIESGTPDRLGRNANGHAVRSGPNFYGTIAGLRNFPRFDMISIAPSGQRFSNQIHTDPGTPSARTIRASGNPARGSYICASGAYTRAKCGIEVTSVRARFCDRSGCTKNLFRAAQRGQVVAQPGDSGAPVYNRFGGGAAAARGMETARTRRDNLYAHKIGEIERHLNVRVLGG